MEKCWISIFAVILINTPKSDLSGNNQITPGIVSFIPIFDHRAHINSHLA